MSKEEAWMLYSDVPFSGRFVPEIVELPLVKGDLSETGVELTEKARKNHSCLGQRHAEWLLKNQSTIPEKAGSYYLIFPGTMWFDTEGYLQVPCLEKRIDGWHLTFECLVGKWENNGRLVHIREQ
jgi:hypothetical protein